MENSGDIWPGSAVAQPNRKNMEMIEKMEASFFIRVLCLSWYTPSCLVYILAKEVFLIEDLRNQLQFPSTNASTKCYRRDEPRVVKYRKYFMDSGKLWTESCSDIWHKLCNVRKFCTN